MDKIHLKNLMYYGYHGALSEENRLGQKFIIDLELGMDLAPAGQKDELTLSVSYADVYDLVKEITEKRVFKLIEALAETICAEILQSFDKILSVHILIKKPEAPVPGIFDFMGVELERVRE